MPRSASLLLYRVFRPLTPTSSIKGIALSSIYLSRIFRIIRINYAIEFIPPYGSVVIQSNLRGVIKPIKSRQYSTNPTQSYPEKKSIIINIDSPENYLENSSTTRGNAVSLIVTLLIQVAKLINRFPLSFFPTRKYRF